MCNEEHDLAIVLENKIDASINNPFESYVRHAAISQSRVVALVLSPTKRVLSARDGRWISESITYDEYFEHLLAALDELPDIDRRSFELLEQFVENISEKERRVSAGSEAEMLEAFWAATALEQNALGEFFKALNRVNRVLRRRAEKLASTIFDELSPRHAVQQSWLVSGNDRAWGRSDGRVAVVYVAYELSSGNCIELMLGQYPGRTWTGFAVKAYPSRRDPGAMYDDFDHVQLEADWRTTDAGIAAEFIEFADRLERRHPR